jgi:hypothetical protein
VFGHFGVPSQPALAIVAADGTVQQLFGAVDETLLDRLLTDVTTG